MHATIIFNLGHHLFNQGRALDQQGKLTEACYYYEQAFAALPEDCKILHHLLTTAAAAKQPGLAATIIIKLPESLTKTFLMLRYEIPFTPDSLRKVADMSIFRGLYAVAEPFQPGWHAVQSRAKCQEQLMILELEASYIS